MRVRVRVRVRVRSATPTPIPTHNPDQARRLHQREFAPRARKVQKFLIYVGTFFMLLIASATVASRVNSTSDLASPQFWALQQYELLHPAVGLFFCLAWRAGLL